MYVKIYSSTTMGIEAYIMEIMNMNLIVIEGEQVRPN